MGIFAPRALNIVALHLSSIKTELPRWYNCYRNKFYLTTTTKQDEKLYESKYIHI